MANSPPIVSDLNNGKVTISTQRLLLRGAIGEDVEGLHKAFSNPEVMAYWSTTPHKSTDETSNWISKMAVSPQNGTTDFIIVHRPTSMPIGKIGVWQDQEIGFLLSRDYWGQGLAKEALLAILSYLFEVQQKNFEQITADVDPRNGKSIALLERVGFAKTGFREKTFEIGGEWFDSLDLSLKREAFVSRYGRRKS